MMKEESFKRIYDATYRLSMKIAFDIIKDPWLTEDICQEVFLKMAQKFDDADENLIRAWIALNTKRKAIDYYRRIMSKGELCGVAENLAYQESPIGVPERFLLNMRQQKFRETVLLRLKEKNTVWHEFMVRVVIMEEDPQAVADEYGITLYNLRTHIHRARVWIRKEFGEEYESLK